MQERRAQSRLQLLCDAILKFILFAVIVRKLVRVESRIDINQPCLDQLHDERRNRVLYVGREVLPNLEDGEHLGTCRNTLAKKGRLTIALTWTDPNKRFGRAGLSAARAFAS